MNKKLKIFSFVVMIVFMVVLFTSIAYADIPAPPDCLPWQNPETDYCIKHNSVAPKYNGEIIFYAAVAEGIIIIVLISIFALSKIKKKNDTH